MSALLLAPLLALSIAGGARTQSLAIPYEKLVLDNGLEVVVHEDHSDPVVAVYVLYHVGSGREEPGRSGFAHLFEHLLFQGSQHVADEEHFRLISEAGGTLNGSTNTDRTNYYETLPSNHVGLALWLESDRMGFLLPAVTQANLDRQREVVRNERRQNYDNRPYGELRGAVARALYPPDHPYSWLTIGSHEDLAAASLEDVHAFFRRWYGPNNATLAVGGDVTVEQVRALAERWFGSIPRGPAVERPKPRPANLARSKRLVLEDEVQVPQLTVTWPTVAAHHADEAALDLLARILSSNASAVLDRALTVDDPIASRVDADHSGQELDGTFTINLRPLQGTTLDRLEQRLGERLAELAEKGVDPDHLERVKRRYEFDFVRRMETVSAKTSALAEANVFTGDPGSVGEDLARHLAVQPADVDRVLERYLVGRPSVVVSVVPEGELQLAASGPPPPVVAPIDDPARAERPGAGPAPVFASPAVWHDRLSKGVEVCGTRTDETPITTLSLSVPAGRIHETPQTLGISSLCAELLREGTRALSTTELAEELDRLGAQLTIDSSDHEISLQLSCLDERLPAAARLLADVVAGPRFAPADFERLKKRRLVAIESRSDQVRAVADDVFARLIRGDGILGAPSLGTRDTISGLSVEDVRAFWDEHAVPRGSRILFVGSLGAPEVRGLFEPLLAGWAERAPAAPSVAATGAPARSGCIYLVDKPGAAQSEIRIGHPSVASTDPDYHVLTVLNYVLGGAFNSRINLNLREDKGWTYGARSRFDGGRLPGPFVASGGVDTPNTAGAVRELLAEIEGIGGGVTGTELDLAQSALEQAATRQYESLRSQLSMLDDITRYGYPDDFVERRIAETRSLTRERVGDLAREHVHPDELIVLVVGDKKRVKAGLAELGRGEVVELALDGKRLE